MSSSPPPLMALKSRSKPSLSSLLFLTLYCTVGTGLGVGISSRTLLMFGHNLDPGPGARAIPHQAGSVAAIQGKYDHDILDAAVLIDRGGGSSSSSSSSRKASRGRGEGRSPCVLTRGKWCKNYFRQERVSWKLGPRGSKECPKTDWGICNGVGNCHYDIGVCQCPAGWKGDACDVRDKRPCTNSHKNEKSPLDTVVSHVGPDGMDLDLSAPGWTASRCAGFCDDDRASCWCPANTTFGRKPAPPGSPPWVRYSERGRVILEHCKPGTVPNKHGVLLQNNWGHKELSLNDVLGENGWCNAKTFDDLPLSARQRCGGAYQGCQVEALHGPLCDIITEEFCLNQCSGHGECDEGFCRCHPGWYGHECARKKAGEELEPGMEESRPWLKPIIMHVPAAAAVEPPAAAADALASVSSPEETKSSAQQLLPAAGRMRPLIYVYDMPPEFNSRMHQYKNVHRTCGYRRFLSGNITDLYGTGYSLEVYMHEMLSISAHRTFDPEEADFFYVPVYYTCWMWPINGWADAPFYGAPNTWNRYASAAHLWLKAKRWIQSNFPFWDRRGGRDHIWLTNHDEGACYVPTEIYRTSIMLTHWGRMDLNHTSNTAFGMDNYTQSLTWPGVLDGQDVQTLYKGHPCYDPWKDLVIPGFKAPDHFKESALLGNWPWQRDILLYLRGDVGKHRLPNYSRGIRQKLYSLASMNEWAQKYRVFIGDPGDIPGNYGEHLSRSVFCVVVPGDGYAMRFEDAVLHGCLPLIIMDGVHTVFESIVNIDDFSLRIQEKALNEHLPHVLLAISPDQIERMQHRLSLVWHRFAYGHGPLVHSAIRTVVHLNRRQHGDIRRKMLESQEVPPEHPYRPMFNFPVHNDALATIMQWLHSRIPYTRGPPPDTGAGAAAASA